MLLTLLSPLVGILGSIIPSVIRLFERKQEFKHEIDLLSARTEAAKQQAQFQLDIENVKADGIEGKSLYDHDSSLDGGGFINALRASIRPVITYIFFAVFVAVKISAAYVMIMNGSPIPEMIQAVWDVETMSLFSTILAFWFGSRTLERMNKRVGQTYTVVPIQISKKK
jgi:hypothetical protein